MTTDNQDELFDIVDENDAVIGQAKRGEAHGNPSLIHRSVGIAVFNTKGELFLQQRSATKDTDPLLWTISCSGHVVHGQTADDAAVRELDEELGIEGVELTPDASFIYKSPIESEFVRLYTTVWDGEIHLHPMEILTGTYFTKKRLHHAITTKMITLNKYGAVILKDLGWIV
jgi:isopentenyl-diphosphate delta-isomerase type 1